MKVMVYIQHALYRIFESSIFQMYLSLFAWKLKYDVIHTLIILFNINVMLFQWKYMFAYESMRIEQPTKQQQKTKAMKRHEASLK